MAPWEKLLWAYDTGAEMIFRPSNWTNLPDDKKTGESISVETAGEFLIDSKVMSSGEILLEGQPLMSVGMTIQEGGWTVLGGPRSMAV